MARAEVRVLPSARNTVMVVDDQSTGRAILEQVVRSLDERVAVEGFARPVDWSSTTMTVLRAEGRTRTSALAIAPPQIETLSGSLRPGLKAVQ